MNNLDIQLENCFGIGKLNHNFNFGALATNSFLIYAPNGTMKTSFARTFDLMAKNDSKSMPCDKVYDNRTTSYVVSADGTSVDNSSILVVNAEDNNYDCSNKISSFIASKELKKRYDDIYSELQIKKNEYLKKLKQVSQSSDCEAEFTSAYSITPRDTFYEIMLRISKSLISKPNIYNFRYNDIFDKKGNVKKFLDKNAKLLKDYITKYDELLAKSKFFKNSANAFGTYQANELLKSTEDNSYFEAGHKLTLSFNAEIKSVEDLRQLVQNEISSIVNDEKLKKSFEQVDKAIGANSELRSFKNAITADNLLLVELEEYDDFRKKVWLNYISALSNETQELCEFYEEKKVDLEKIINDARNEFAIWREIINTFNERFYVPFQIKLVNQEDVVLKEETANLEFDYTDPIEAPVRKDKNSLLSILSKGEQRAFYILQFLFDVAARQQMNKTTLVVLDDIADSFDYKNKYAIIEYIKELHQNVKFRLLILTHNFDFYRTVAKRLCLVRRSVLMTIRNERREISLVQGEYLNDIFSYFKNNLTKTKVFVSIIPLVRNLIEYIEGQSSRKYQCLTSCLHIKPDTHTILCDDILKLIHNSFPITATRSISFGTKLIKDVIFETADSIEQESPFDEILLENKIALSMAIRLKAEQYMLNKIAHPMALNIRSNQTSALISHFKTTNRDNNALTILERVNLMTPENIHVNAFMFEPLIDISMFHLVDLYKKVKLLI